MKVKVNWVRYRERNHFTVTSLEVEQKRYIKEHNETVTEPHTFLIFKTMSEILGADVGEKTFRISFIIEEKS